VCIFFIHKDSPHPASHDNSVAYQLDLCAVFSSTRTPLIQHNMMILLPITPMHSPEGGALKGVNLRVFPNLMRTHRTSLYVNNSLFIAFASFLFGGKEIFPWERGNT
jgi:hypothetical protein